MPERKPDQRRFEVISDDDLLRDSGEIIIPLASEEIAASTRPLQNRVRIRTSVASHVERVEVPLQQTGIEVKRVPVGRVLDEAARTRTEGDVTIIPVMEERLVTRKELVLLEEIHLIPRSSTTTHVEDVTLRKEVVTVERFRGSTEAGSSDG
jgi:uncharacterized protein (TIGR02271 family)